MADYTLSNALKIQFQDLMVPSTGTIGHLTLIDNTLLENAQFSVNASTDTLTFVLATKLVTGSRIRITATTTIPGGLLSSTDYYAIFVSTTAIKLASTLANAIGNVPINIADPGSGILQAFEQELSASDSLSAIVAHEIISAAYPTRREVANLGSSTIVSGDAEKNPWVTVITNSTSTDIVFGYKLIVFGGTSAIGNSSVSTFMLQKELLTIFSGAANAISIKFRRAV